MNEIKTIYPDISDKKGYFKGICIDNKEEYKPLYDKCRGLFIPIIIDIKNKEVSYLLIENDILKDIIKNIISENKDEIKIEEEGIKW